MQEQELPELIRKYLDGTASREENRQLSDWYRKQSRNELEWLAERLDEEQVLKSEILQKIQKEIGHKEVNQSKMIWRRIAVAASILFCFSVAAYFFVNEKPVRQQISVIQPPKNDLLPGSNKAILTLAGGKQIVLTGAQNGKLAMQGNVAINKTADGRVAYDATGSGTGEALSFNTMTTPRGGQYHLTLADGTNVWLNAASSITYPTAFPGKDRAVEITGEAYFEVAHNAAKPFRVTSNGQTVEVLGTHFNINAYGDEPAIKTTLFEGSVKVSKGLSSALLKPGEQSAVADPGNKISIIVSDHVDTEQALAWKNGKFSFNETNIREVMRQVARWYDVDIEYQGQIPDKRLSGTFYRNMNASKALTLLEYTGINFKIEGRKIMVK